MTGACAQHALACHPVSRTTAVRTVQAGIASTQRGALALRFQLRGDMARIEVPCLGKPERRDGLWRHTCFECFVRACGDAYLEFNFSPTRAWAAYAFRGYRDPAPSPADFDPCIALDFRSDGIDLDATIPAAALPSRDMKERWRIGLSAVIEDSSGVLTYWALRHAEGKPDFHHDAAFALEL